MPRALTSEDLYAFALVEEPQISPDGATIAFVKQEMDRKTYEYRRSIWLQPTSGGPAHRITSGANDTHPRWSPDGQYLAFLRGPAGEVKPKNKEERDAGKGMAQLYILPLSGGEAQQVTSLRFGAGEPVWSPDSKTIAFSAQTGAPDDAEADDLALQDVSVPKVRTITQLFHKLDSVGYIYELRAHLFTLDVARALSGALNGAERVAPKQHTDGDWNDSSPRWSPDGKRLVFTSDRSDERWSWPADSVWTLDVASGQTKRLTDEALGAGAPAWSPDGQRIAFLGAPRHHGDGHTDLFLVAANAIKPGSERKLTQEFTPTCEDHCIDDMRGSHGSAHLEWSPDSQELYFLASSRGTTHVYAARPNDAKDTASSDGATGARLPRQVTGGACRVYAYSFDKGRKTLALAVSDPTVPGDLYTAHNTVGDLATTPQTPRRLTNLNEKLLSEVALAVPEEFSFRGADNWELQGWVMRPASARPDEKLPAILEIHGGPAAMYGYAFFIEFQLLAAKGYAVIYSNPRGSTGYGRVFSGAVIRAWGDKDFTDVMAGLDAAIARGGIDENRLGVAGGSYGGYMTNWAVGHSNRFKAGVTMRSVFTMEAFFGTSDSGWMFAEELGFVPWRDPEIARRFAPYTFVENIHTPLLIIHSDQDLRCPVSEGEQLFTALKFLGRETKFVRFEGQSHELSRAGHPRSRVIRLNEIVNWFTQHIPSAGAREATPAYAGATRTAGTTPGGE